jgi:hypothetical protein
MVATTGNASVLRTAVSMENLMVGMMDADKVATKELSLAEKYSETKALMWVELLADM